MKRPGQSRRAKITVCVVIAACLFLMFIVFLVFTNRSQNVKSNPNEENPTHIEIINLPPSNPPTKVPNPPNHNAPKDNKPPRPTIQQPRYLDPYNRFDVHVNTDKDIYRPGENIFLRGVVLNSFTHRPYFVSVTDEKMSTAVKGNEDSLQVNVLLKNALGEETNRQIVKFGDRESAFEYEYPIPVDLNGGEYSFEINFETWWEGMLFFTSAERNFQIQEFSQPRFSKVLEFAKTSYTPGDTVEFTGHVSRSEGGEISKENSVVKILVNVDGKEVFTSEIPLGENGEFEGVFDLPDMIEEGRGSVTLVIEEGVIESKTKTIPIVLQKVEVDVYPEGGYIVEGLTNGVYLQVFDINGVPIDFEGVVMDQNEDVVIEDIQSIHGGRGYFELKYVQDDHYYFQVTHPVHQVVDLAEYVAVDGVSIIFSKPFTNENPGGDKTIDFSVESTEKLSGNCGFFKKEKMIYNKKFAVDAYERKTFSLSLDHFRGYDGVHRLTILDLDNYDLPLAERLLFIEPRNTLEYEVSSDKRFYEPGEKAKLQIGSKIDTKFSSSYFSIVVTDDSTYQMKDKKFRQPRLISQVFFEKEVENLEDPEVFLGDKVNTDLLLGTQGWRKFVYNDVVSTIREEEDQDKKAKLANMLCHNPIAHFGIPKNGVFFAKNAEMEMMDAAAAPAGGVFDSPTAVPDMIPPMADQEQSFERVFAEPSSKPIQVKERIDFRNTVFFAAMLETDANGGKEIEFNLNDAVTSFRVFIDGFDENGVVGSSSDFLISSKKPLFIDCPALPSEVLLNDVLDVPCLVANNVNEEMEVQLSATSSVPDFKVGSPRSIFLEPMERRGVYFTVEVLEMQSLLGKLSFTASAFGGEVADRYSKQVDIFPTGFPVIFDFSGRLEPGKPQNYSFQMPETIIPRSSKTITMAYASPMASLTEGLRSLVREPHGCFEQTSSVLYPSIMAQQYFKSHEDVPVDIIEKNDEILKKGFKRLLTFEVVEGGGFEWFGHTPAHEALTAMGINEFVDLAQVYSAPSEVRDVIDRTTKWLLSKKTSEGFLQNSKSLDSFGYAPKHIADVYILWALSESGVVVYEDVRDVIEFLMTESQSNENYKKDPYFLGLLALSLKNLGQEDLSMGIVKILASFQKEGDGSIVGGGDTSVTNSRGKNYITESTCVAMLNFLNYYGSFSDVIEAGMEYILAQNSNGRFGSTQSTILALKVIVQYDKINAAVQKDGKIVLSVNSGGVIGDVEILAGEKDPFFLPSFEDQLVLGEINDVVLEMIDGSSLPFSMRVTMNSEDIDSIKSKIDDRLSLSVSSDVQKQVAEGQNVQLEIELSNNDTVADGMIVAIVALPSGLEVDFEHLIELRKAENFVHFELIGSREVVFYWLGLHARETKKFTIRTTAKVPGVFQAKPSRAYHYYDDDKKSYTEPMYLEITKGVVEDVQRPPESSRRAERGAIGKFVMKCLRLFGMD